MHDHGPHAVPVSALSLEAWLTLLVIGAAVLGYLAAALRVWSSGRDWPLRRLLWWLAGWSSVAVATVGPVAAHHDFVAHMTGHLLIGMAAPLFLVLAAPVTVLLRGTPVAVARRVTSVLRSRPATFLAHPLVAATLAVGGLWVLYRTELYRTMTTNPWWHSVVQVHVLASGYLLTYAVLGGPDPAPHRTSPLLRGVALFGAIAAHAILAKLLYATPPVGVPANQAHTAAELMYYGAMPVELVLVTACCLGGWPRGRAYTADRARAAGDPVRGRGLHSARWVFLGRPGLPGRVAPGSVLGGPAAVPHRGRHARRAAVRARRQADHVRVG